MEKLKVKGPEAKKGSTHRLTWAPLDIEAFENLKRALSKHLSLNQVQPDCPFQIRTDASDTAIGAVLNQERNGKWVPVCFFSRKLTTSQMNWSPREKEAYAVIASLTKWAGWIGSSEVTVVTDHKSMESWIREAVDTPSGPTGRRARWHEILSQFRLSIVYQPGPTNIVADAMSRYAYPASQERQDVCIHGTATAAQQVKDRIQEEEEEMATWREEHPQETTPFLQDHSHTHSSSPSGTTHSQHIPETYTLVPETRDWALEQLGIPKGSVALDLFATRQNATHPLYITKEMDAFTYSWDQLTGHSSQVLWANPPFSKLPQVVTKVALEPCRMVLVTPEWRKEPWWTTLDKLTVARVIIPAGDAIYSGEGCTTPLPGPVWRTVVSLVDSTKWSAPPFSESLAHKVRDHCQGRDLEHLCARAGYTPPAHIYVSTRSGRETQPSEEEDPDLRDQPSEESEDNSPEDSTPPQSAAQPEAPPPPHTTSHQPRFKFWRDMTPEERHLRQEETPRLQKRRYNPDRSSSSSPPVDTPYDPPPAGQILDEPWTNHYLRSALFNSWWRNTETPQAPWPSDVHLHQGRMYHRGKLCVPESLVERVLWEFHSASGHLGVERMAREVGHRFVIPDLTSHLPTIKKMVRACHICQASNPPQNPKDGQREPFPVPERLMHSVCLDVFAMPPTTWEDVEYDSILLCVDRLSGWIVACPTLKVGLTAEKAAHLILDKSWDPFGIPTTVHSDMGPQFVGQWWRTMCARLGIHQTFSQPHRPRANGRAERGGQQLLSVLKKLHIEHSLNWVQALPRALRLHHDVVGEGGLSPYHIMFGRDRSVPGIPYTPERVCEQAVQLFTRMEDIDSRVAKALNAIHQREAAAHNLKHPSREEFSVKDLVWVLNPDTMNTQAKLQPRWRGPFQVNQRTGNRSYLVQDKRGATIAVHVDQLKPYHPLLGEPGELAGLEGSGKDIERILGNKENSQGDMEYLVQWKGETRDTEEWVPLSHLIGMNLGGKVEQYHSDRQSHF